MLTRLLPLLVAAAETHTPPGQRLVQSLDLHPWLLALPLLLAGTLAGCGLLMAAWAPGRLAGGAQRCGDRIWLNLAYGTPILLAPLGLIALLPSLGLRSGFGLIGLGVCLLAGAGLATSARALGRRLLPESGSGPQLAGGLCALLLPSLLLIGISVTLAAAILGLGAWLRGGQDDVLGSTSRPR